MAKTGFYIDEDGIPVYRQAVGELLDYTVDFTAWLTSASIVGQPTVTSTPVGLTISNVALVGSGKGVQAYATGGTPGMTYTLTYAVETNAPVHKITPSIRLQIVAARG